MIPRRLGVAVVVLLLATIALGMYVWHLKRTAESTAAAAVESQPITPPVTGPSANITLFVASDDDGMLHRRMATITLPHDRSKQAREILHALVAQYLQPASEHKLGAGADVVDVYLVDGQLAVIDTNRAFADAHRSGILAEELTLASMAETLAANVPGIVRIKLLVEGQERATLAGHIDLLEPYNVADAAAFVKE